MVSLLVEISDKLGVAVGGSALAIYYENFIIVIEKLLRYPHLVGEEARDDFVSNVTNKIKNVLKKVFFTLATCMPETTILCATNLIYSGASSGDELRSWLSISNSIPNILHN